ncbi:PREDICTED: uncharacterized protein LOC108562248 [Nicrophorus vespilloides]|uniref:Uncharacterized protein LOC108562248 n=1 Tax=Nicrophorus vespilloides TaxID=110193 RepID=A0ABM1MN60_NICVS|nr:PREDICTED: uncharacterized protein LOC108562248 [Nicrophorus vespilloides]
MDTFSIRADDSRSVRSKKMRNADQYSLKSKRIRIGKDQFTADIHTEDLIITENNVKYLPSWKDIIFLPYNYYITISFLIINFISCHIYTYELGYNVTDSNHMYLVYIVEMFYIFHTTLLFFHRLMHNHRKKRINKPIALLILLLDIISIIPVRGMVKLMNRFMWEDRPHLYLVDVINNSLKMIRIFRMLYYYLNIREDPSYDQKKCLIVFHFIVSTIISHFIATMFYQYRNVGIKQEALLYPGRSPITWVYTLSYSFDVKNLEPTTWFIITYTYAFGLQIHNSINQFLNHTPLEKILTSVGMYIGFVVQYMFFLGSLISEHICDMRFKLSFEKRLKHINNYMELMDIPRILIDDVNRYYKMIWNCRRGLIEKPKIFTLFSAYRQSEITTDIYWEAMMHSQIFTKFDDGFKRELSGVMQSVTYLEGQYIFKINRIKSKMIYLVAGIIEVLSEENDRSAVLSFSSGTILGEIDCIIPNLSNANIRCATQCELHILEYHMLWTVLLKYKEHTKTLLRAIDARIQYARYKRFQLKWHQSKQMSHIFWIKDQWRKVMKYSSNSGREAPINDPSYSSKYLNLLVLSSFDELKVHSICIRGKCSFIMDENSSFRLFLHYICLSSILAQLFINFYLIAFSGRIAPYFYPIITMIDMVYILDIYVQSITAIMVKNVLVTKPSEVFILRSKQISFIVDVAASIPYDYMARILGTSYHVVIMCRIPKFLKLYKIRNFFVDRENAMTSHLIMQKFCKFICIHMIILIIFICITYLSCCFMGYCNETSWWFYNDKFWYNNLVNKKLLLTFRVFSIYYKAFILTISYTNTIDIIVFHLTVVAGFYMNIICYVQLSATSALSQEGNHNFTVYLKLLEDFIRNRREIVPYQNMIFEYTKLQYSLFKNIIYDDLALLLDQKSHYLKYRLRQGYVVNHLKKMDLFCWFNPRLLDILSEKVNFYVIPPGHTICEVNKRCFDFYVVMKGYIEIESNLPGDKEKNFVDQRTAYTLFPPLSLFHDVPSFINVKTVTAVQLMAISVLEFRKIMKMFPEENQILSNTMSKHMSDNFNMLNRVHESVDLSCMYSSLGKVDTFTYKLVNEDGSATQTIAHTETKFVKFMKKILWDTYDPNGRSYEIYEWIRSIFMIFYCTSLYVFTDYDLSRCHEEGYCNYMHYFYYLYSLVDMYIKAHLQYYNEYGLKVTDARCTYKHYLSHTFFTDIYSSFPIQYFKINMLFGKKRFLSAHYIILYLTRPVQLYRFYALVQYKTTVWSTKKSAIIRHVMHTILAFFLITQLAIFRLLMTCLLQNNDLYLCPSNSWITVQMRSDENFTGFKGLIISMYMIFAISISKENSVYTDNDYVVLLIMSVIIIHFKLITKVFLTGYYIFEDTKLVAHQNSIKNYMRFIKDKCVGNKSRNEILAHVENIWQKCKGEVPSVIFGRFYPKLKHDVFCALNRDALNNSVLFDEVDESFMRLLVPHLEEYDYKKDADIIRCNDVQQMVYIVGKGKVEISLAGHIMCALKAGGTFGCFKRSGSTRQTISVKALVHTRILCIHSQLFHEIIDMFPLVRIRVEKLIAVNSEFVEDKQIERESGVGSFRSSRSFRFVTGAIIRENCVYYMIFDYITCVHVATITSFITLFISPIYPGEFNLLYWVLTDVYFVVAMYIQSMVSYTEPESGISILKLKPILKRYFKSFRFIIAMLTNIPFYLIHEYFYKDCYEQGCFTIHKCLRILYLLEYYTCFVKKGNVPKHIQWVFLFYLPLFILQVIFNVWWWARYAIEEEEGAVVTQSKILSVYLHVFNVFTTTGIIDTVSIISFHRILGNLLVLVICFFLLTYLTVVLSKMLLTNNYNIHIYKIRAQMFKNYCSKQQVSPPIVTKTWEYLMFIYKKQNGELLPKLLQEAPVYIKQDHMLTMYGKHFVNHTIFSDAHVDFLRQLLLHLHSHYYLPGEIIVECGDKNGTIYFIEEGCVAAIDKKEKMTCLILKQDQSFGEVPGLKNIGYPKTYRSLTISLILSIKRSEWKYLLDWFPASREIIYRNLYEFAETLN